MREGQGKRFDGHNEDNDSMFVSDGFLSQDTVCVRCADIEEKDSCSETLPSARLLTSCFLFTHSVLTCESGPVSEVYNKMLKMTGDVND